MPNDFDSLSPLGNPGRTNETPNQDIQPGDHNALYARADQLLTAGQLLEDQLEVDEENIATLETQVAALLPALSSQSPGVTVNIPVSGTPYYPLTSLERWLTSPKAVPVICNVGSSLSQATIDAPANVTGVTVTAGSRTATAAGGWPGVLDGMLVEDSQFRLPSQTYVVKVSGTTLTLSQAALTSSTTDVLSFYMDGWVRKLARGVARMFGGAGPIGYGFLGLWGNKNPATLEAGIINGWSLQDTSSGGGKWAVIPKTSAADVALYGEGYIGTSAGTAINVSALWQYPDDNVAAALGGPFATKSFEIVWIDIASGANWSYSIDGGSWVSMGQTRNGNNKLRKFFVNLPINSTLLLSPDPQSGGVLTNAPGSTMGLVGIIPYFVTGTTATGTDTTIEPPAFSAPGFIYHDTAHDGAGIGADFFGTVLYDPTSAGDTLAMLDLLQPDLVIMETAFWDIHANNLTATQAAWNAIIARIAPYADLLAWNQPECGSDSSGQQSTWRGYYKTWAAANGVTILDMYDAWAANGIVGKAAAMTAGLIDSAGTHCSQLGHSEEGARFHRVLRDFS